MVDQGRDLFEFEDDVRAEALRWGSAIAVAVPLPAVPESEAIAT